MAVSFTRFPWCLWGGKDEQAVSNESFSLSTSIEKDFGYEEPGTVKFPWFKRTEITPSQRKVKRKWQSREERRLDREYDVVLVPSDGGGCLSGSESDDSDWSVGWLEPHGPDFLSDDESDNSFAVLVPCYSPGCKTVAEDSSNQLLSVINNLQTEISSAGKNYMEQWLSSLQNFEAQKFSMDSTTPFVDSIPKHLFEKTLQKENLV